MEIEYKQNTLKYLTNTIDYINRVSNNCYNSIIIGVGTFPFNPFNQAWKPVYYDLQNRDEIEVLRNTNSYPGKKLLLLFDELYNRIDNFTILLNNYNEILGQYGKLTKEDGFCVIEYSNTTIIISQCNLPTDYNSNQVLEYIYTHDEMYDWLGNDKIKKETDNYGWFYQKLFEFLVNQTIINNSLIVVKNYALVNGHYYISLGENKYKHIRTYNVFMEYFTEMLELLYRLKQMGFTNLVVDYMDEIFSYKD